MNQYVPVVGMNVFACGGQYPVRLGDAVFYYVNCNFEDTPQIGIVIRLQEGFLADIFLFPNDGFRTIPKKGVHVAGDTRLDNPNIRANGCWVPRPSVEQLAAVGRMS